MRINNSCIRFRLLLIAIFLFAVSVCYKKVDWTPIEFEKKPIVNSVIKSGNPISVKVSIAVAYSAQTTPEVDNAEVLLFVDNEYLETLAFIGEGLYQSEHVVQEEREYRCEVTVPGYQTAICSTNIPKHQNIIMINHINKAWVDEEGIAYPAIELTFSNYPDKVVFYQVIITMHRNEDDVEIALLDNVVDPILLGEGLPIAVFSNQLIEDSTYIMTLNYNGMNVQNHNNTGWVAELNPIQVELRTVCYNYYTFIKQQYLYEQTTSDPIFSVGSTSSYNLYSNVQNGYGIFAGYSSVKSEIIYP